MLSKPKSVVARSSNDLQLDRSGASRWFDRYMTGYRGRKTLSTHAEIAKAFSYILKQWNALNAFIRNGQVEIDNNIAQNVLRGVALGRKNWLFAGSDKGGETAVIIYSLIGISKLNGVEPESWLR